MEEGAIGSLGVNCGGAQAAALTMPWKFRAFAVSQFEMSPLKLFAPLNWRAGTRK